MITPQNVSVLRSTAFDIPKARGPEDLATFLERSYTEFCDQLDVLGGPLGEIMRARLDQIRSLAAGLVASLRAGSRGDRSSSDSLLAGALEPTQAILAAMSRRHSARVLPRQSWYRLASWKGVESRRDMFHTPFEMPQGSYRFSTPGAPTLYLANSVYLCWLECGRPDWADCYVSRFEIDTTGFDLLDLPCNHQAYLVPLDMPPLPGLDLDPRRHTNSPYMEDVVAEVADYLTVWPLFLAASVRKHEPAPTFPPEYTITQGLMRWTQANAAFLGIRYFSSKEDRSTNSQDWAVNLAVPTRTTKAAGYCDFLRAQVRCTLPQQLSSMDGKAVEELLTPEAADRREAAQGRYMLTHSDGTIEHYATSIYGKMEYWLDRADVELASIDV